MLHQKLTIEVEPRCLSVWKKAWAKRLARVTLLVDFGDRFVIVRDASCRFWFLPEGGEKSNESVEETAKREAAEELGLEIRINRIVKTFYVTLVSKETREELRIPPFIVVHTTYVGGQLKTGYSPMRRIYLVRKDEGEDLLQDLEVPREYEWMIPYVYVSREVVRDFLK